MSITTETTIGQIAAEYPIATRVLARHKIDFVVVEVWLLKPFVNKED